ncbi:hypothetical protein Glove_296g51 [Diversispora epigaea]|uniref:Uncharacterized protein n=1 Tax=Diversispora epigaea TaxID=1348612 RepID=A0A397HZ21_9GLOM|nr:hypothetical protein Glove_296g51 [Diversispora epigaea]
MLKIFRCYKIPKTISRSQQHSRGWLILDLQLCARVEWENSLSLNSKTEVIQTHLQPSGALQSSDALSPSITIQLSDATDTLPPQASRELTHLLNTPNKRLIEKEELWE